MDEYSDAWASRWLAVDFAGGEHSPLLRTLRGRVHRGSASTPPWAGTMAEASGRLAQQGVGCGLTIFANGSRMELTLRSEQSCRRGT